MKVRIIKTSKGYLAQVQDGILWEFIDTTSRYTWTSPEYVYTEAVHLTKWGAMRTLKRWLKKNVKGTAKLEAFTKELKNPNVVYEAEV